MNRLRQRLPRDFLQMWYTLHFVRASWILGSMFWDAKGGRRHAAGQDGQLKFWSGLVDFSLLKDCERFVRPRVLNKILTMFDLYQSRLHSVYSPIACSPVAMTHFCLTPLLSVSPRVVLFLFPNCCDWLIHSASSESNCQVPSPKLTLFDTTILTSHVRPLSLLCCVLLSCSFPVWHTAQSMSNNLLCFLQRPGTAEYHQEDLLLTRVGLQVTMTTNGHAVYENTSIL